MNSLTLVHSTSLKHTCFTIRITYISKPLVKRIAEVFISPPSAAFDTSLFS